MGKVGSGKAFPKQIGVFMKKFIFFLINIFSVLGFLYSEPIIGLVDQATGRGISNADDRYLKIEASSNFYPYAQGNSLSNKIDSIETNYYEKEFGNSLSNRIDSIETNYYEKEFGNALSGRVDVIETGVVYKTDSAYTNTQFQATTAYNSVINIHGILESSTNLIPNAGAYKVCDIQLETNAVIQMPTNSPTDGYKLQLRIRAVGDDREIEFGEGIKIPTSSSVSSPITIESNTVSIFLLDNYATTTNWFLSSYIQGYEVDDE